MESKQCTNCKRTLLLEQFRTNKRTCQVTKQCIKCLDTSKKSKEKRKCIHGKQRSDCKDPICGGGGAYCQHQKRRSSCKECGGGQICEHNKIRSRCKECGGSQICKHNKIRSCCKDCGGSQICEHDRIRSKCKDCGGSQICSHKRIRSSCKDCGGGSICSHDKVRSTCLECGGGSICSHKIQRRDCKICNPTGHLASIVRNRIYQALKHAKDLHSVEYLDCNIDIFKQHIESQFKEGMTWENHGEWHIDHKIPLKYKQDGISPTLEEVAKRLHYTNTQPLWASDNISKGNRYIS